MAPARSPSAQTKSTTAAPTAASGIARRGKYTFVINRSDPTTLLLALAIAVAKNVQGKSPAQANSG